MDEKMIEVQAKLRAAGLVRLDAKLVTFLSRGIDAGYSSGALAYFVLNSTRGAKTLFED